MVQQKYHKIIVFIDKTWFLKYKLSNKILIIILIRQPDRNKRNTPFINEKNNC